MENSKIEWTDHTFNPWWGCMKVSEGCKNCYAETLDNRYHHQNPHWGPNTTRKPQSNNYWQQPVKWNREAEKAGTPAKVFCASMADVFEGHPETLPHLERLFKVIEETPFLTWQLLTKRPEHILKLVPDRWSNGSFPDNVWIGTSVEDQKAADKRIPYLLTIPAKVRFLSMEPLIGPVDLSEYIILTGNNETGSELAEQRGWGYNGWSGGYEGPGNYDNYNPRSGIQWVITGGESGHGARPMNPEWVKSIRDQCSRAEIPFFFKQWGEWAPRDFCASLQGVRDMCYWTGANKGRGGGNINNDHSQYDMVHNMGLVGKKMAGNLLDGKQYLEFPI